MHFAVCRAGPQVEAASADIERRQAELQRAEAAAASALEEVQARERAVKRQEDGLEGLKVRRWIRWWWCVGGWIRWCFSFFAVGVGGGWGGARGQGLN